MSIKKIKAPIGDENHQTAFSIQYFFCIKKIKAPIGDENTSVEFYHNRQVRLRK